MSSRRPVLLPRRILLLGGPANWRGVGPASPKRKDGGKLHLDAREEREEKASTSVWYVFLD